MWRQRARSAGAAVRMRMQQQQQRPPQQQVAVGRWLSTSSAESSAMLRLLQQVAAGEVSPASAVEQCRHLEYEDVGGYAKIDTNRFKRTGFPEVVYAEGKTPEQVAQIMDLMVAKGVDTNVMATRVAPSSVEDILAKVAPDHRYVYYPIARILASKDLNNPQGEEEKAIRKGIACILCAGTSDLPVAEEAAITLANRVHVCVGCDYLPELAGYEVKRLYDVGVAGIHRLLRNQHVLHESDVAICVAGMDGALPGVVVWGRVSRPSTAADDVERVLAWRGRREHRQRLWRRRAGSSDLEQNAFSLMVSFRSKDIRMGRRKPATPRRRVGVTYVNFATPLNPMASTLATATGVSAAAYPSRVTTSPALPVLGDSSRESGGVGAMGLKNAPVAPPQVPGPSFEFDLHKRVAIPGLDEVEPPKIEKQFVDASPQRLLTVEKAKVPEPVVAAEEEKVPVQAPNALKLKEQGEDVVKGAGAGSNDSKKNDAESRSSEDASSAVSSETDVPVSSPSPPSPLPPHTERFEEGQQRQQQRQRQERGGHRSQRMITISATELERWQQRVVHHVEDHFSSKWVQNLNAQSMCGWMDVVLILCILLVDEQLKRIAEFGRAHANLLVEAKEYVYNIEAKLQEQFERDRAELRAQAEAYVAEVQAENRRLCQAIAELRIELEEARTRGTEREEEEEEEDEAGSSSGSSGSGDEVEIVEQHEQEPIAKIERSRGSKRTSSEDMSEFKKKDDRSVLKSRADRSSSSMIVDGYGTPTR
ncbi:hypothetical protein FI667_g1565, partial [Globisporangium splendens]